MGKFVIVAKMSDVPVGEGRVVDVNGKEIALFNLEGAFHAIDNTCIHRGGPLGEGLVDGTTVICPWHAWTYDVPTGECQFTDGRVEKYEVMVKDGDVKVAI